MNFSVKQDFTSLTELLRFYGDVDEIVFRSHCQLDESEIAETCRKARRLSHHLRLHHGAKSAEEVASCYGCAVTREAWPAGAGRVVSLADYCLPAAAGEGGIRVNADVIGSLAKLMAMWAAEGDREWFSEAKITEVAIAHQLFYLIEQDPPSISVELGAQAFSRAFTGVPFSPLLYRTLLARLGKGPGTWHRETLRQ